MNLEGKAPDGMDSVYLAQDTHNWQDLGKATMNFRVPENAGSIFRR